MRRKAGGVARFSALAEARATRANLLLRMLPLRAAP
jgi:hypothetical protein